MSRSSVKFALLLVRGKASKKGGAGSVSEDVVDCCLSLGVGPSGVASDILKTGVPKGAGCLGI